MTVNSNYRAQARQSYEALNKFERDLTSICKADIRILRGADITEDQISVDAIVVYHGMLVTVIEIVRNNEFLSYTRRDISKILKRAQVRVGVIITLTGEYYLRLVDERQSKLASIEEIAKAIEAVYSTIKETIIPEDAKATLMKMFDASTSFSNKKELRPIFDKACDRLIIKSGQVYFQAEDEIRFMLAMLGVPSSDGKICRYTSLNSLFYMIDSRKHAMCSPVSMNDKNECSYANKYMPWNVDRLRGEAEIEADNSYFLLSCSSVDESDMLTMWRLYGDNAKGVCIEYEINADKVDNEHYFLANVSYGHRNRNTGKVTHPELQFISDMQATEIDSGWHFSFSMWYIWKFFFKAWTYKEEHEVRLIHVPEPEIKEQYDRITWYKDQSNGIFNRMALIPIELLKETDFPLTISKITLGPQSPEAGRNKEQIEYMIMQKGLAVSSDFMVATSAIENYRT